MASIKKTACFVLLAFCFQLANAQTWSEWWSQKKTQISYLEQQIVALQVYGGYLKKGYDISQNGLGTIGDWKNGEFGLHTGYFNSLKAVNPVVRDNPKAAAIAQYLQAIPGLFDQLQVDDNNRLYVASVRKKVLTECDRDVSELQMVMTANKAEMSDDERLKRLDKIYLSAQEKYTFVQQFCNQVRLQQAERRRDELEN